ncbi:hypothetical protein EON63_22880 [archaeon]|nr:MAG: hypothetical protein EON63_22880 [archaeon]
MGLHGVIDFHLSFLPYVRKEVQSNTTPSTNAKEHKPSSESGANKVAEDTPLSLSQSGKDLVVSENAKGVKYNAIAHIQKVLDEVTDEVLARDSKYKQAILTTSEPNIPVILLTYNRPQLLDITLQSLLTTVVGLPKDLIYILQDGQDEEVMKVCQKHGLNVHQNKRNLRIRDGK